ncbi:diguanylate cyclase [Solirubrobacter sp. CPCC 204708]|uniref:Diguanylate cyclase n=1 Tax=Solirubrobacter deserti TaxID=2282478 RepID=A0ABT4RQ34_9ACTN|nr:diguanylate cyclase [Solirubrobacter deserti]MBE2320616.1 diguanylate cyclase [Solirubrobacter deserti]MDA0140670.1 diguanylate cyclase [Solirubrobacter deserti]
MPSSLPINSRARLLLGFGIAVVVLAVWFTNRAQHEAATRAFEESQSGQGMLTAMLDQQTGLRGFALTRREEFLDPYRRGQTDFTLATGEARSLAGPEIRALIDRQVRIAEQWQRMAEREIARLRADQNAATSISETEARKRVFDRLRAVNAEVQAELEQQKDRELAAAGRLSIGLVIGISLLFGVLGFLTLESAARSARRRRAADEHSRAGQAEFTEMMQVMRDEAQAYGLVKRHLERSLPGGVVTILNRNHSDNRIAAATPVAADSPLNERLTGATPEDCLAVRLARSYEQGRGYDPLVACSICGNTAEEVTCVPSLVGGEVIGAVLVQSERPIEDHHRSRVTESVAQAGPVLANLRMLAIAETRAATDALTGLPNARSCQDTLKRMVAHAGRAVSPFSAVLLDLDHFKQINDRFGHGAGDDVLAAVGQALSGTVRASDFAGRLGGEEFVLLLPDTDQDGALEVAEKVRNAVAQIDIARVEREITASLGIATYPLDATDGESLLRQADRALYAAKAAGRNRVELTR